MSHYTVMVIGPEDEDDVGAMLAPYYENLETGPRRVYVDEERLKRAAEVYKCEPTFEALEKHWNEWSGTELKQDHKGKPYYMTTYNENSKWDWYEVGGRWSGDLLIKPEFREEWAKYPTYGHVDGREAIIDPVIRWADYAPLGAIDVATMRAEAALAAEKRFDAYERIIKEYGPLPDKPGEIEDNELRRAAWREYWAAPIFVPMQEAGVIGEWEREPPNETYGIGRDAYVRLHENQALCGFATLFDGEWFESGKMGWFGTSTATIDSTVFYREEMRKIIDSLPEETMIWIVDCHI